MDIEEIIFQSIFLVVEIAFILILVYETKILSRQIKFNIYMDYYTRYYKINRNLPNAINYPEFDLHGDLNDPEDIKNRVIKNGRAYFDLCSEEYYFYGRKRIDKKTWKEWEEGILYTLELQGFRQIWEEVKKEGYDKKFVDYIDDIIKKTPLKK